RSAHSMRPSATRCGPLSCGSRPTPAAGAGRSRRASARSAWRRRGLPPRAAVAAANIGAITLSARVGAYAELSKFGIVLLVLVSAAAGFMLRAPLGPDFPWPQGLTVLLGVMLLSCGASALNQVQEQRRDSLMARTARRPLPSGRLSTLQGLWFAG